MEKQIAIYGAFDRFNYGDLLFAIILKIFFAEHREFRISFYALIDSDLSRYGGKPTDSVNKLFDPQNLADDSIVIIAGGEVLSANWFLLHSYLLPSQAGFFLKLAKKIIGNSLLDELCKKKFKVKHLLPFVLSPDDFHSKVKVAYNSVGGIGLTGLSEKYQLDVTRKLRNSSYIAVRDYLTKKTITQMIPNISIFVAPDSAALMTKLFPPAILRKKISHSTQKAIDSCDKGYVCLQCANRLAKHNIPSICLELQAIYEKYQMSTILLPLGRASGHEDQIVLKHIHHQLKTPSILLSDIGVYDIMATIAFSSVFFGSSLHGNITAMAYGVPHLGLTDKVHKLDAYLKTWALPDFSKCIPFDHMSDSIKQMLKSNKKKRLKHAEYICSLAEQNMLNMKKSLI